MNVSPNRRIKQIIERIANDAGYTYKDVMAWDRRVPVVRARHLAMVTVAREFPHLSTTRLGSIFKRDFSTVIHALKLHGFRVSENGTYGSRQRFRFAAGNGGELNQTQETGVLNEHT